MHSAILKGINPVEYLTVYGNLEDSITQSNNKLLFPYKMYIKRAFDNLSIEKVSSMNYMPRYIKYKGKPCVIFCGVFYDKVLNTSIMDNPTNRAKKVYEQFGESIYKKILSKKWDDNAPFYTGLHITYYVKDFTEEFGLYKNEDIILFVPTSILKSFTKLNITGETFYKSVEMYVRDWDGGEIKYIK
jgi:hypothetical protein